MKRLINNALTVIVALSVGCGVSSGYLSSGAVGLRVGLSVLAAGTALWSSAIQAQVAAARLDQRSVQGAWTSIQALWRARTHVAQLQQGQQAHAKTLRQAEAHGAFVAVVANIIMTSVVLAFLWTTGDV